MDSKNITYQWKGTNIEGKESRGIIDAPSLLLAKMELNRQGILLNKIRRKFTLPISKSTRKITQNDIVIFTRQIAVMIEAGIPLIQIFTIINKGQIKSRMKILIETIKADVETGLTFTESLQKHPVFFNKLYCSLVDAGEKSGSLEIMMKRLAHYKENIHSLKRKLKKALVYPASVLITSIVVTTTLLIFVIPQFAALFQSFGAELPLLTRGIIMISNIFQSYWYWMAGSVLISGYSFNYARKYSRHFSQYLDRAVLRIPIWGPIFIKTIIARFSRTLATTFASGLPLVEALQSAAVITSNSVYEQATYKIRDEISTGQQMQIAIENTGVFPRMMVQLIAIGEESGKLELMLNKVADYYEDEVNNAVETLNRLLEPLIISILGILIGFILMAMYVPIFKLGTIM
ncbi:MULTISPECIES: type II secretion system F family protein [unclassified Legionella]|uniref:type II secretion system F family protein n=1 Tax=unclassified Legionella TaxID=2622702 RepID=UPI001056886E|nr:MULTISPECIES: type II secretion system F family protein [unclassified Legionella]MDI9818231.1 type II secretion system F family protein [Legionella sp. PL877]